MSSKRHLRRKACENKIQYFSVGAAYQTIKYYTKKGKDVMQPYKCRFCGWYHIGHTPSFVAKERDN
jgi:hypothetical protein